jgi:hypothetical protein
VIYICIRQTTDWTNEAGFWSQLPPEFRPTIELWNECFNIPYHLFRHRLRQISQINLSAVRNATRADWEDVPEGAVVLPVDDDDWFSEDAAIALESIAGGPFPAYRWPSAFVEVPIDLGHRLYLMKTRIFRTAPKWYCTTNNYAVIKSPESKPLFVLHVNAHKWFLRHPEKVVRLDRHLSVMNRTLASRTSLGLIRPETARGIGRSRLLRKYHQYRELYRRPPAPEIDWCRPYLSMVGDLMDELSPRA